MTSFKNHLCKLIIVPTLLVTIFTPFFIGYRPSIIGFYRLFFNNEIGTYELLQYAFLINLAISILLISSLYIVYFWVQTKFIYFYFFIILIPLEYFGFDIISYILEYLLDYDFHDNEESLEVVELIIVFRIFYLFTVAAVFDLFLSQKYKKSQKGM